MKNYLKQIHGQIFGDQFSSFLEDAYARDVSEGMDCEELYLEAVAYFSENWSGEERKALSEIESLQMEKCAYAGEYAFDCGMNVAFEQLFTGRKDLCFDFSARLNRGLYEVEGMKRHPYYYERANQVRKAYDMLEENRGVEECEHLTSHECRWDQRICSGAAAAYYLGYRTALAVIERVRPLSTQRMMDQIIMLEYQLGITRSAAEREWRSERKDGLAAC